MNYLFHYSYQYLTFILINFPGHQRRRRVISERSLSKLFTRMPMKLCKTLKKGKTINCKFRIEEGHMLRFTGNVYQYTCQWDGLRSRVLSLQTKSLHTEPQNPSWCRKTIERECILLPPFALSYSRTLELSWREKQMANWEETVY